MTPICRNNHCNRKRKIILITTKKILFLSNKELLFPGTYAHITKTIFSFFPKRDCVCISKRWFISTDAHISESEGRVVQLKTKSCINCIESWYQICYLLWKEITSIITKNLNILQHLIWETGKFRTRNALDLSKYII